MKQFLNKVPKFLFFTGKGGVGKTSMACSTAVGLAEQGKKILLISTDPASNLDEVLETKLCSKPVQVNGVPNLFAMNINPIEAAAEYRERMVGPYRGILPDATIKQMEEQLSGACTVEIAGFSEFSKFVGDESVVTEYDHVVLDTAPTGHTLRLLNLPSAWNDFIEGNKTGSSCLGPVSGLSEQKILFENVVEALKNPERTLLVMVSRAEIMSFNEANRASLELREVGLSNQHLIINGLFVTTSNDEVAGAFAEKSNLAIKNMPQELKELPITEVLFRPAGVMGIEGLKDVCCRKFNPVVDVKKEDLEFKSKGAFKKLNTWDNLLSKLEADGNGVIMTMGKGGVGKTSMAAMIATQLAKNGHSVLLSTTDPAAHLTQAIKEDVPHLQIERIDPKVETENYRCSVLKKTQVSFQ